MIDTEQPPYTSIQYMGKPFSDAMDANVQQTIHNVAGVLKPLAMEMDNWPSGYIEIRDTGTFTIHSFPPQLTEKIMALLR